MFRRAPRITEEEKNQIADKAWDAILTPVKTNPDFIGGLFDAIFSEPKPAK